MNQDQIRLFNLALLQMRTHNRGTKRLWSYREVYEALGMTEGQISGRVIPDMAKTVMVDGIEWTVKARKPPRSSTGLFRKTGMQGIRLGCACPICGKNIPAGRLEQHAKSHPEMRKLIHPRLWEVDILDFIK